MKNTLRLATVMLMLTACTSSDSNGEKEGINTVRIHLGAQPQLRGKTLENVNSALATMGPDRTIELQFSAAVRAGTIIIVGFPHVQRGTITFETRDGAFVVLANKQLRVVRGQDRSDWRFRGQPGVFLRIEFVENATFDPVILFVNSVETLEGKKTETEKESQGLPYELDNGTVTVHLKIKTSVDFVGDLGNWEQPRFK